MHFQHPLFLVKKRKKYATGLTPPPLMEICISIFNPSLKVLLTNFCNGGLHFIMLSNVSKYQFPSCQFLESNSHRIY